MTVSCLERQTVYDFTHKFLCSEGVEHHGTILNSCLKQLIFVLICQSGCKEILTRTRLNPWYGCRSSYGFFWEGNLLTYGVQSQLCFCTRKMSIDRNSAECPRPHWFSLTSEQEVRVWLTYPFSGSMDSESSHAMTHAHRQPDTYSRTRIVAWYICMPSVQSSCIFFLYF